MQKENINNNKELQPKKIKITNLESLFTDKLKNIEIKDNNLFFTYDGEKDLQYIGNKEGLIIEDKHNNSLAVTENIITIIADDRTEEKFVNLIKDFAI